MGPDPPLLTHAVHRIGPILVISHQRLHLAACRLLVTVNERFRFIRFIAIGRRALDRRYHPLQIIHRPMMLVAGPTHIRSPSFDHHRIRVGATD